MKTNKQIRSTARLVNLISDFLQPWVMRHIDDVELKGKLIKMFGSMKQAIYGSKEWNG